MNGRILWPLLFLAWLPMAIPSKGGGKGRESAPIAPPLPTETPGLDGAVPPPPSRMEPLPRAALSTPPLEVVTERPLMYEAPFAMAAGTDSRLEIVVLTGGHASAAWVEVGHTAPGADAEQVRVLRTNQNGRLGVQVDAGTLRVAAWSERSTGGPQFFELGPGARERCRIDLARAYEVTGRVLDEVTGEPVENASVSFWTFAEQDRVQTALDGTFRHERFPSGELAQQIRIEADGFGAAIRYLRIDSDGTWTLPDPIDEEADRSGTGIPHVEIALTRALKITGRVVRPNGEPIPNATIFAEGYFRILPRAASVDAATAEATSTGVFALAGLRSDIGHSLLVSAPGFADHMLETEANSEGALDVGEVVLTRETLLAGVVVDADGYPVEDVEVEVLPFDSGVESLNSTAAETTRLGGSLDVAARTLGGIRATRTSPEGTFVFESMTERPHRVSVARDGDPLVEIEVHPAPGTGFEHVVLRLPPECLTLEGRLQGPSEAIAGARIEIRRAGWSGQATADREGRFRIAGLDDRAPYELEVRGMAAAAAGPLSARIIAWAHERPVIELGEPMGLAGSDRR